MLVAHAQIQRAGGAPLPERMLCVIFDNALPDSYSQVRQAVRRAAHATFAAHFADYLTAVRAEVDSRAHSGATAFPGFVPQQPGLGPEGGRGRGRGMELLIRLVPCPHLKSYLGSDLLFLMRRHGGTSCR